MSNAIKDEFEKIVLLYTGRDMDYHQRYGTVGLEFAQFCYQAGHKAGMEAAATICGIVSETGAEAIREAVK